MVDDPDALDPEAPKMTWVYWVLYNLFPAAGALPETVAPEALPPGSQQGLNDWNRPGYGGPCPPIGRHRYFHQLYALDTVLTGFGSPTKAELVKAMEGHISPTHRNLPEGRSLMMFRTWSLGMACLILNLETTLAGDLPGNPYVGRKIAESWCGECHDVEPNGIDVYGGVPAFQTLADNPAFTETALRAFLQTPHGDMPNVMPTREQTDHIIAYILNLKSR